MRNVILLFLGFGISAITSAAEVTVFNNSKGYDMEISYVFCSEGNPRKCDPVQTLTIPSKKSNVKNYITLQLPSSDNLFGILSAVEKDNAGKIVSQGNYSPSFGESTCGAAFEPNYRYAFVLDDIDQSPLIICPLQENY